MSGAYQKLYCGKLYEVTHMCEVVWSHAKKVDQSRWRWLMPGVVVMALSHNEVLNEGEVWRLHPNRPTKVYFKRIRTRIPAVSNLELVEKAK